MRLNIFAPMVISWDASFQIGVTSLAALVWQVSTEAGNSSSAERRRIMPSHSLELVHRMRAALNEVMTKVPTEQATPEVKAYLAEIILKAAAGGQTDYEVLLAAASEHIQIVLSQLMPSASVPPTSG
jgi:hypothetical protein